MKNRSLVLTVSLIAMMIVGAVHGAQIASTDYVTKSVGDEADLVWTAIDSINNETTGVLATAKSYTDTEITSAMEEVADAIPTDNAQLTNGAGYITAADIPDAPTVDAALSSTSTNAVQNKVVTAALNDKLGKNEKAASAATADSATTAGSATKATQDASGNVITETYALKTAIPTNNNQLTNGANYITAASLPGAATASAAGIMKWGQIPSGSATSATAATIWVQ